MQDKLQYDFNMHSHNWDIKLIRNMTFYKKPEKLK